MALLKSVPPMLKRSAHRQLRPQPKKVDQFYRSPEWRAQQKACLKRDNYTCVECGAPATIADHIISRRKGGADALHNLRSLCRACDNKFKEDWHGERRGGA